MLIGCACDRIQSDAMNEEPDNECGDWRPAAVEEVARILKDDLTTCDAQQIAAFSSYAIEPRYAPITRYGKNERVVVVAQRRDEVIYWEDVEEGFNLSPISSDGRILEHWCNQNRLGNALDAWIEGRSFDGKFGPALPIDPFKWD